MSTEDRQEVEAVNLAFYRALESQEIERLEELWAHESWVRCVHPGWDLIAGWPRVRESWVRIFEGGQKMRAYPTDITVQVEGNLAWVTCTENITVFDNASFDTAQAAATNLFIRRDGRWLMIHHHASPIPMIVPDTSSDTIQ
jgi:ketosteroid isomerase-like protein